MTQQIARQERPREVSLEQVMDISGLDMATLALIKHTMAASLSCTPEQVPMIDLAMFTGACRSLGLDPLVKQAYWIKRNGKGTLQIAIDGFRAIADGAGNYAGSSEPVFRGHIEWQSQKLGKTIVVPEYAQVTVWKIVQGHKAAFTGEARWAEYAVQNEMWATMPHNQLAKCAESQALRKGWALKLGGAILAASPPDEGELPTVAAPRRVEVTADDYDRIVGRAYDDLPMSTRTEVAESEPVAVAE